jgi:hypothetical protein
MAERTPGRSPVSQPQTFVSAVSEDLLTGRLLRRAFLEAPLHFAERYTTIIRADDRSHAGKRHRWYRARCFRAVNHDIVAATTLAYRMLSSKQLWQLMANSQIATRMLALMAETRWCADRLVTR